MPVFAGERQVAVLRVGGALHSVDLHAAFVGGLLQIGGLTFAGVVGLALYLTRPLRRMSRSMDRIALGELAHRVEVRGGDEVWLSARAWRAGRAQRRRYRPGVASADLARLFEPFFRADPSRSRATGASGLGLMIVRRAVAAHGGDARAERSVRGGLAVCFDLAAAMPASAC